MSPKILLVHSGHSFSTSDVYDGLLWGLRWAGAEVVEYRWDKSQHLISAMAAAAVQHGLFPPEAAERMAQSAASLAGSDAIVAAVHHEVDAVLVVNGLLFPPDRANILRRNGVPVACYGTEAPYMEAAERNIAWGYSHWFTQERSSVARMADLTPTTYLPLAYHPERHTPGPRDPDKAVDAVFVGGGYPERKALLDGVNWQGIRHARLGTLWHLDLDNGAIDADHGMSRYSAKSIPAEETIAWHRSAAIVLNAHRRMTYIETREQIADGVAESCNPRVYEVPALGGFLLTDPRPELADILGDSAATYRSGDSADLERQIRYWLARPDRREATAAAQRAAIAPHHWGARARIVLDTLMP